MMFLSGVFFPREQLPGVVRAISDWLPLTNAVELVRPLFMDQWPAHPLRHGLVMALTTVAAYWTALALTRRRFAA
jgi:lipooligosaccharide transport system permease protein